MSLSSATDLSSASSSMPSPSSSSSQRNALYIVGINVTHTIAPPMHDYIAHEVLDLPQAWSFTPQECPTIDTALTLFRAPSFAGGVVTMPYKKTIMPLLDELDDLATRIGACNGVYLTSDNKLRGTNTDWRGIKGCLLNASPDGKGKAACIMGAGGASRAAVYALGVELGCSPIYVVNRDEQEVKDLVADAQGMADQMPTIVHVQSTQQSLHQNPFYIVGTVPDFEPSTPEEVRARDILETFFRQGSSGLQQQSPQNSSHDEALAGVFLDMCFKPRVTRQIKLAKQYSGWHTVEGTGIIGHQIEEQWRLWTGGKKILTEDEQQRAWAVLNEAAEKSVAINF